jgi:crotonobetainyl-CoA:carnitine CoA-transferase CaiB-like acyl-CoA transferase
MPEPPAPLLDGVRAVEFGQLIAAPFVGLSLLDLGAEVIKVEPPAGDAFRSFPPYLDDGTSALFAALNRGKRGVVADLADPAGRELAAKLIDAADVVVENLGDARAQLPLSPDEALAAKQPLVWCSITGWGSGQPGRALDPSLQAAMGMISITGEEGGPAMRIQVPLVDFMTGMYGAQSVLVALWRARATGEGGFLDCAMVDGATTLVSTSALLATSGNFSPRRLGADSPLAAPSGVFLAGDGKEVQIVCVTTRHWRALCAALGRPDWGEDPAYADNATRLANRATLHAGIAELIASDTAAAWVAKISRFGAICEHVRDIEDAWADPRLAARGLVGEIDGRNPDWAKRMPLVSLARPYAAPAGKLAPAPALGADTVSVERAL